MNKLAVVFNTCGIKRESPENYITNIKSILDQDFDGSRIILSSCLNSEAARDLVRREFGDNISYNYIDEVLPVNVTFNHSCIKVKEHFGDFEGYVYVDSGITFKTQKDLSNLYEIFKKTNSAMVSSRTDTDSGYHLWFGVGDGLWDTSKDHELFNKDIFKIPIGKTVNLHVQIFSNQLFDYYGYMIPDIYAGYCTESVFSFLCAAINKDFVVSRDVIVSHLHQMDIGSSGFDPLQWQLKGGKPYEHPFLVDSILETANKGHEFGFGYEECEGILMHDPDKFDENGYAKDHRLKDFIRDTQFVGNIGLMDYDKVNHTWKA